MLHGISRLRCVRLHEPDKETAEGSDLPRHPLLPPNRKHARLINEIVMGEVSHRQKSTN